jgi:hypothetical protein
MVSRAGRNRVRCKERKKKHSFASEPMGDKKGGAKTNMEEAENRKK